MKKVAYLLGAGVAHAEAKFAGADIEVLTADITEGIQARLEKEPPQIQELIGNDLAVSNVDVEQLISLYESTGTSKDNEGALFLRDSFMKEVVERLSSVDSNSAFMPTLLCSMFEMHRDFGQILDEELVGIVTVNYDDYAERALQNVFGGFDYGITMAGAVGIQEVTGNGTRILLLKLHGSFKWLNDFPPKMSDRFPQSASQCLWIPPGVEKKNEKYPFNIIWGKAKERLDCDVLRVVGCSLSRNDWQLISLLHAAKRVRGFAIEYIDYQDKGNAKKNEYPYLNITPLLAMEGFRKHLSAETSLLDSSQEIEEFAGWANRSQFNCLYEWLKFRKRLIEDAVQQKSVVLLGKTHIAQI